MEYQKKDNKKGENFKCQKKMIILDAHFAENHKKE